MSNTKSYRIHMHSRPAMGRTFYDGHVDVFAEDEDAATQAAIAKAARVHGHRDWIIEAIESRPFSRARN